MPVSYRSTQVRLNKPSKVLSVSVSSITGTEFWPHAAGTGDRWFSGSASRRHFRWRITFSVNVQQHGSHLTRDDFEYNGLDIVVGDWIAGATDGRALKIISIEAKTRNSVTCIVEDWLRYNTFKNTTGVGIFGGGAAVVFTLNENGIPMLDPLPTNVSQSFYPLVMSRFQYLNPQLNYVLEQKDHGFSVGDVVSAVKDEGFVRANAQTADRMVGVVTEAGPGPDYFILLPNNRIIDFDPSMPGVQGEFVYVTDQGTLSNAFVPASKIAFLTVQSAVPTVLEGQGPNPEVTDGYTISLNNTEIVFDGEGSNVGVHAIAQQINDLSNTHLVTADVEPFENTIESEGDNTVYGLVGGFPPFSAFFDTGSGNTEVVFTTSGSTFTGVSTPRDMKADIDAANIANLVVTATTTVLTLTELNGNAISISNGDAEQNGNFFVGNPTGTGNISGLPEFTASTDAERLTLTRSDGGEILIFENTTLFQDQTGIFSAHTGSVPLVMNIEEGIRTGETTVVGTIEARDALQPAAGDQAFVVNKGDGEWGMYLFTGSEWVIVGTQDSATVDARTLTTVFEMPVNNNDSEITVPMGNISVGRKVTGVSVTVNTPPAGGNDTVTLDVGTATQPALLASSAEIDLTEQGTFVVTPEFFYNGVNTQDITIQATLKHFGATVGNVAVKVTYV